MSSKLWAAHSRQTRHDKKVSYSRWNIFDTEIQSLKGEEKCKTFNADQQKAFTLIMHAIFAPNCDNNIFFLNAPGSCGKTFLIEGLLATVRGMGKKALAVASSGIAAELFKGRQTAHSRFKIPIPINENLVCSISLQSQDAKLLWMTSPFVQNEVMMSNGYHVDCVDRLLSYYENWPAIWRYYCCVLWRAKTNISCNTSWLSCNQWAHWQGAIVHSLITEVKQLWARLVLGWVTV